MTDDDAQQPPVSEPEDAATVHGGQGRAARVAERRALLEMMPGDAHDLDAAAECECGCHPRPGSDVHDGQRCVCQLTKDERAQRWANARASLADVRESLGPVVAQHRAALAAAAERLGVEATEVGLFAPWVIVGTLDGRAFSMRERWEAYEILVAPDDNPLLNPWGAPQGTEVILVASGTIDDLYIGAPDYDRALTFIVAAIRSFLRRRTCTHDLGGRYCPRCGTALIDPELR